MNSTSPNSSHLAKIGRNFSAERSSPWTLPAISMPRSPRLLVIRSSSATASSGAWNGTVPRPAKRSGYLPMMSAMLSLTRRVASIARSARQPVIRLVRRRRHRLHVNAHMVHIAEALFQRCGLRAHAALVLGGGGGGFRAVVTVPGARQTGRLDHRLGQFAQRVAVDIDRKPFAASMRRAGKPARDCLAGRADR